MRNRRERRENRGMNILGIHYGHDANAAVIRDGRVVFAVSEERLNRKKLHRGFPFLSIESALRTTDLRPTDFDWVAVVNLKAQDEALGGNMVTFYTCINKVPPAHVRFLSPLVSLSDNVLGTTLRRKIAKKMVVNEIARLGFAADKIVFVDHHLAHAAGGYFLSGFDKALVITSDGKGDHVSHRTYYGNGNELRQISESADYHSVGLFYSCITTHLGFKRLRHEGKITGLAAFGNFEKVADVPPAIKLDENRISVVNTLLDERDIRNMFRSYAKLFAESPAELWRWLTRRTALKAGYAQHLLKQYFKKVFSGTARELVASYAQHHLEDVMVSLVRASLKKHPAKLICLSGGTFANVCLNQKIAEIDGVENIFVQPAMGDGGLSVGAAMLEYWQGARRSTNATLDNVYFGPAFTNAEIEAELKQHQLRYECVDNIERKIAEYIVAGKIVGRFNGAMEWGPRALGNRSILASAEDRSINDTLNKRLQRTEFMPFAPIILHEHAAEYFRGYHDTDIACQFMAITYDMYENKIDGVPAIVHIDNTARPQVVRAGENESLYRVLLEYKKLTGLPVLINTSFNMHEEPIVCTPKDALRAFCQGAVDVLAIGDFVVIK